MQFLRRRPCERRSWAIRSSFDLVTGAEKLGRVRAAAFYGTFASPAAYRPCAPLPAPTMFSTTDPRKEETARGSVSRASPLLGALSPLLLVWPGWGMLLTLKPNLNCFTISPQTAWQRSSFYPSIRLPTTPHWFPTPSSFFVHFLFITTCPWHAKSLCTKSLYIRVVLL